MFDFLDGGAETEWTARENITAFDNYVLVPRCLASRGEPDTKLNILGADIEWPLICSPTGASRLFHTDGEIAIARAACEAGTIYGLSSSATFSLEQVADSSNGPKMFQVYVRDRTITYDLIRRAHVSNYDALCLTVDVGALGKRERDLRSGFGIPPKWSASSLASFAAHPAWVISHVGKRKIMLAHPPDLEGRVGETAGWDRYPPLSWQEIAKIANIWGGPMAVKGVICSDDARRAIDVGATTIIISNHGGRQLDGAATPLQMLPEISDAVGDRVEIILDGGIRRGVHILKAMALGAKACSVGRAYLYGLGAGGEAGVSKALQILRSEFSLAMQLAGCNSLDDIGPHLVRPRLGI